jgi:hypothetical protein
VAFSLQNYGEKLGNLIPFTITNPLFFTLPMGLGL